MRAFWLRFDSMLGPFWLSEAPNSIKIPLGERLGIPIHFGRPFGVQFITFLSMGTESARKCRVEDAAEEQGGGTAQLQCQSGAHKNEGGSSGKSLSSSKSKQGHRRQAISPRTMSIHFSQTRTKQHHAMEMTAATSSKFEFLEAPEIINNLM